MENKADISYGVIPIKKIAEEWRVFLIHQYSRIGNNTYWILPKGHPEEGELPKETAIRELQEETGLLPQQLLKEPTFAMKYSFNFEGKKVNKTVVFYLGIIEQEEFILDPEEVAEAGWYPLDEVIDKLDYDNAKQMFAEAKKYIEEELKII